MAVTKILGKGPSGPIPWPYGVEACANCGWPIVPDWKVGALHATGPKLYELMEYRLHPSQQPVCDKAEFESEEEA